MIISYRLSYISEYVFLRQEGSNPSFSSSDNASKASFMLSLYGSAYSLILGISS